MRTRTTLAAAMIAVGALLGWLAGSSRMPAVSAQDKKAEADPPRNVLPIPEPPFEGQIGRTGQGIQSLISPRKCRPPRGRPTCC